MLLLQLLPQSLLQPAPSTRLRMSLEMLPMDTRTSTLPSKNLETLWEESPDLTPMLMRLESTPSIMLLMPWDSEPPVTTSQLLQFMLLLLQSMTLLQLLTLQRLLRPRLPSSRLMMLPPLVLPRDLLR